MLLKGGAMPAQMAYDMYIDGEWAASHAGRTMTSLNPYSGEAWASIQAADEEDVDRAVRAAQRALPAWRDLPLASRAQLLRRLAELMEESSDHLATIDTTDNGKPVSQTNGQVRNAVATLRYFASVNPVSDARIISDDQQSGLLNFTRVEPLGVVAMIVPWNSPLSLASWKLAPALIAGNTVVWKPSEHTSASTLEVARLVADAGFPPGVINVVTGEGATAGAFLTRHPLVAKISFTGGTVAGRDIASAAARNLTRVSLELGGKSAQIVFADANLDRALADAVGGMFTSTGQTCVAGSRLLLEQSIHDDFLARVIDRVRAMRLGDPLDPATEMGPVTTRAQFETVQRYVELGLQEGATLAYGGTPALRDGQPAGLFYEPTVLSDVTNTMQVARDEIFGPVLSVIRFADQDEAISIANDSRYGLAAGIWTRSLDRSLFCARKLEAGSIWINGYRRFSPSSPFGGYKDSGYGRENGIEALREYSQVKSIWLAPGD